MQNIQKIACIGEVMIELIAGEGSTAQLNVAGDTYNAAVYLARLLKARAGVDYITVLGEDRFSDRITDHMIAHGVGTSAVRRHPSRMPGLYAIDTDAAGERSFSYWRDASAAKTLFEAEDILAAIQSYDLILLTGISLAILPQSTRDRLYRALAIYRANGGLVAFDSNYRPHLWGDQTLAAAETARMWALTDIALPSIDDEMAIFEDVDEAALFSRFAGYGVAKGALKRGDVGPLAFDGSSNDAEFPVAEHVVDTTAAGDSFNAGYLAALIGGGSSAEAKMAGHRLASRVIGYPGAIIPERAMPDG